ncbi:MAG: folC [Gammaproteobacteria bacterium]|jgi:dihydrofolate synthase/folylpolyglutamate synthase|nr:folC [Gammaproteobacteria bacterium]
MNLAQWLSWIKSVHHKEVDLSLERVFQVAEKLELLEPSCTVVTVAGTNGKGSCVAGLEAIMLAANYKTGAFTTPFIWNYNEQIRLQGLPVVDEVLCKAFEEVQKASGLITLTPFEFGTLAALVIFKKAKLDIWILEVGMGGRYDAVNIISADVAIIASIGIDHVNWLGHTREAIAYEKAGVFRTNKPAIYGDFQPPLSVLSYAHALKTPVFFQGQQFGFAEKDKAWSWWSEQTTFDNLPLPRLGLQNMSTVLMAIELLKNRLPVSYSAIDLSLKKVFLPGRIQVVPGEVTRILDVSHNPAAVEFLAEYLRKNSCTGKTYAVFSMLADKDIVNTIRVIQDLIDHWYVAPLTTERKASSEILTACFQKCNLNNVNFCSTIKVAEKLAMQQIVTKSNYLGEDEHHRLVVFGSFHTVAEVSS